MNTLVCLLDRVLHAFINIAVNLRTLAQETCYSRAPISRTGRSSKKSSIYDNSGLWKHFLSRWTRVRCMKSVRRKQKKINFKVPTYRNTPMLYRDGNGIAIVLVHDAHCVSRDMSLVALVDKQTTQNHANQFNTDWCTQRSWYQAQSWILQCVCKRTLTRCIHISLFCQLIALPFRS